MADRLALAFALALVTAPPVLAQSPEAPTTPRYEIGVETSPLFKAFLDTNGRFPPSGWVAVRVSRFRLQIDYLRDLRGQPLHYAAYYGTDEEAIQRLRALGYLR